MEYAIETISLFLYPFSASVVRAAHSEFLSEIRKRLKIHSGTASPQPSPGHLKCNLGHNVPNIPSQVAELIGAHSPEIIFTSCATESNNAAIHAALKANPGKKHVVTSMVEHSSVLNYCMALEKEAGKDPETPPRMAANSGPSKV